MTAYLIKSTVAMGVLLGLYYILFEREKMHRFNRFYLISALVFSLALPFITIITYIVEVSAAPEPFQDFPTVTSAAIITENQIDYWFYAGWGIYLLVTFIMLIRFIKNVWHFVKKSSGRPSVSMENATLILLEEKVLPHTFLNWIFVNREEHEARMIQDELYTHELTHVRQKHTLDILFIEALKTLFWFNPLLYFYKNAIQLNHEFLADEKVIDSTANTVYYQNLLLEKASVGTTFSMASNLNFSLTKKRLLMMTKTTSTAKAVALKIAIAPVIAGLLMLFCTETIAQEKKDKPKHDAETQAKLDKMIVPDHVMDSLKAANPDMFSKDLNIRYKNSTFRFVHKDGTVTEVIGYASLNEKQKKLVSYAPEMYNMSLEMHDDEETIETSKESAKDPNVLYKNTKFKFTDKDGNVTIKTGYMTLTEEDRKKVAPVLPAVGNKDIVEYTETEKGFHLHQGPEEDKPVNYNQLSATPDYPGGKQAFLSYFNKNYNIPKIDSGTYKIYLSFIVEEDGSLSNVKCISSNERLAAEAIRVTEKSEKWIPAQKDGVIVRASYNIPVTINVKN
jgi:hypothetical protein